MTEQHTSTLIVFARLPADGKNKTRLIPALGASGATEVYRQLVTYTLEQVEKLNTCKNKFGKLNVIFPDSSKTV